MKTFTILAAAASIAFVAADEVPLTLFPTEAPPSAAADATLVQAGTDKTLNPTPEVTRPRPATPFPLTPFPTEESNTPRPSNKPVRYLIFFQCVGSSGFRRRTAHG